MSARHPVQILSNPYLPSYQYIDKRSMCCCSQLDKYICTIRRDVRQMRNIRSVNTSLPTIVRRGKNHNSNGVPRRVTSPALSTPMIISILPIPENFRIKWLKEKCILQIFQLIYKLFYKHYSII